MSRIKGFLLACVLFAVLLLPAPAAALSAPDLPEAPVTPLWTMWGGDQYALADDGASLWIGATGGIVRWDKQRGIYRRYSAVDGLPHTKVLAVAVDAAGNRWFGGDGGLSVLDASENWTHIRQSAGGLYSDFVDGIAVGGDNTLYFSHGLPAGSVSRRDPDGSWRWFPNRDTAVQADYDAILQTRAPTPLWTVVGKEVWAGTHVFDGERWYDRKLPDGSGDVCCLAADGRGHVWATHREEFFSLEGEHLHEWDGAGWLSHRIKWAPSFYFRTTALAVDANDTVWVGGEGRYTPYGVVTAFVTPLDASSASSLAIGWVRTLLSTPEGIWAIGEGWLRQPDATVTFMSDTLALAEASDVALDANGKLWISNQFSQGYGIGSLQTLDDKGTLPLEDDLWTWRSLTGSRVTALERTTAGIWYADYSNFRGIVTSHVVRYDGGERIEYDLTAVASNWFIEEVTDIFAQDTRHTWFATEDEILGLDDGGTPADQADDVWQTYPIEARGDKVWVAVDAAGRLWSSHGNALYRYDGAAWQTIYSAGSGSQVCDLVPAANGTLFAHLKLYGEGEDCGGSDDVFLVRPDGKVEWSTVSRLVMTDVVTIRSIHRRNDLWTVAPDGAIWYLLTDYQGNRLQRVRGFRLNEYTLPPGVTTIERLEVDRRGHVWLVANAQLWRMAGPVPNYLHLPLVTGS